jgi:hypothetical protein
MRQSDTGNSLQDIRATLEALLEQLAVDQAHGQPVDTPERRRGGVVERLLSGGPVGATDVAALGYELHGWWHLGLVATGSGAGAYVRALKAHFGGQLLAVSLGSKSAGWLRARSGAVTSEVDALLELRDAGTPVAIGEPGRDLDGWRLTHKQAADALRIAERRPSQIARYAHDRLLAGTLRDATLVESLRRAYLAPLGAQRDRGVALRQTLRAYIDLECNATSAAHALRVGRRAVKSRVSTAERLIGRSLRDCLAELDVALRLAELEWDR